MYSMFCLLSRAHQYMTLLDIKGSEYHDTKNKDKSFSFWVLTNAHNGKDRFKVELKDINLESSPFDLIYKQSGQTILIKISY